MSNDGEHGYQDTSSPKSSYPSSKKKNIDSRRNSTDKTPQLKNTQCSKKNIFRRREGQYFPVKQDETGLSHNINERKWPTFVQATLT